MTDQERAALRTKYPAGRLTQIRKMFDEDVQAWKPIQDAARKDLKCVSTDQGPWPDAEWQARHTKGAERSCLHEDVLTQYVNQVINPLEANPAGIEAEPSGQGATPESAEYVENRIRQIEYEGKAALAHLQAAEHAVRSSFGCWKLETYYDADFSTRVCFEPIADPMTVIPGFFRKPDASDMRRCWELERMTISAFRERFPQAAIQDFEGVTGEHIDNWINREQSTIQVCAWYHLEDEERELLRVRVNDSVEMRYADEYDGTQDDGAEVLARRKKKTTKVLKTLLNGVEALDETEWIDPGAGEAEPPEIPIFWVFGRMKFEDGQRIIESLVRKGIIGNLLYDYLLSTEQECFGLTPRTHRIGPEGTFDTSTNWDPRSLTPYKEYKPVNDPETNTPLGPPVLEQFDPRGIQYLEMAKQSILIGIQNAIGMASTERKDRAAKSGKALEQIAQDMTIGQAHYLRALRIAQEREYRMLLRILPALDAEREEVGLRDRFGKHDIGRPREDFYRGRHAIAVGTGTLYQTLQDKQSDFADILVRIGDPGVLLAVLPGAIRMKGLGEWGDELADMIEAIQPPAMQQARQQKQEQLPPEAVQAIRRASEELESLHAYAKELEKKIIQLEDQIQAKTVESESKERISASDNETKIHLQAMKNQAELEVKRLELEIEKIRATIARETQMMTIGAKANMQERQMDHESSESQAGREHEILQGLTDGRGESG